MVKQKNITLKGTANMHKDKPNYLDVDLNVSDVVAIDNFSIEKVQAHNLIGHPKENCYRLNTTCNVEIQIDDTIKIVKTSEGISIQRVGMKDMIIDSDGSIWVGL